MSLWSINEQQFLEMRAHVEKLEAENKRLKETLDMKGDFDLWLCNLHTKSVMFKGEGCPVCQAEAVSSALRGQMRMVAEDEYEEHYYGHPGDLSYETKAEWTDRFIAEYGDRWTAREVVE